MSNIESLAFFCVIKEMFNSVSSGKFKFVLFYHSEKLQWTNLCDGKLCLHKTNKCMRAGCVTKKIIYMYFLSFLFSFYFFFCVCRKKIIYDFYHVNIDLKLTFNKKTVFYNIVIKYEICFFVYRNKNFEIVYIFINKNLFF